MFYKDFQEKKLSALGLGMMRLPVIDGDDAQIDYDKVDEMVDYAMSHGINYYDTAWGYHNGNSELAAGRALSRYPRESYNLSTKFPGYDLHNMGKVEEIFEKQLEKCQVEYFDFYLVHNVCELNIEAYLDDEKYKTVSYLVEQKKNGRIKHLGFSCHGEMNVLKAFLDRYGKDMEFCQLQLNYFDWKFQDAKAKVELLDSMQIPVWVMEPLRGGRLCKLTDAQESILKELRPEETITQWAFRFLQTLPSVTMTLSGMSNMEQLAQNIETYNAPKPLSESEMNGLMKVVDDMLQSKAVPCTACHYCVSHCPKKLEIPDLLAMYNQMAFTGDWDFISRMHLASMPEEKHPSACVACHSCEKVCPQQIKIPDALDDFAKRLGER